MLLVACHVNAVMFLAHDLTCLNYIKRRMQLLVLALAFESTLVVLALAFESTLMVLALAFESTLVVLAFEIVQPLCSHDIALVRLPLALAF